MSGSVGVLERHIQNAKRLGQEDFPEAPRLGASIVVARDGPWVLLFTPTSRDLAWVDLEQIPFLPFPDDG